MWIRMDTSKQIDKLLLTYNAPRTFRSVYIFRTRRIKYWILLIRNWLNQCALCAAHRCVASNHWSQEIRKYWNDCITAIIIIKIPKHSILRLHRTLYVCILYCSVIAAQHISIDDQNHTSVFRIVLWHRIMNMGINSMSMNEIKKKRVRERVRTNENKCHTIYVCLCVCL